MRTIVRAFLVAIVFSNAGPLARGTIAAQAIPRTTDAAEAEGAAQPASTGTVQPTVAGARFSGTSTRRCVAPPADDSLLVDGALRSGEIVARTRFTGRWGIRSGRPQKIMWLPLHAAAGRDQALVIRAARLDTGAAADSLRKTVLSPTTSHGSDGYPSSVRFPAPGTWLVVATSGSDWGCFVIPVAP